MAKLATFWSGRLSPLEQACLTSFVQRGHDVAVYSYDEHEPIPGVTFPAADTVLDRRFIGRFLTNRRPNIAHFADYFRLLMMRSTGETWIDCDVFCLDDHEVDWQRDILVQEASGMIINCVLKIANPTLLDDAIRRTEALFDRDLPWAATQNILPQAIKTVAPTILLAPASRFSPVEADHWAWFLLPEHYQACEALCEQANTVHVYNNILQKIGYLKSALPPEGSYLRALIDACGLAHLFRGEYPAETVRTLQNNWLLRFSGAEIGFRSLMKQFVPSMRRTAARYRWG